VKPRNLALVAAILLAAPAEGATPGIHVLSTRADLVAGGRATVVVTLPRGVAARRVRITLGRHSVRRLFAVRPGRRLGAVVTGLRVGRNVLTVLLPGGRGARLTITDHPNGGPIFAGPEVEPWACQKTARDKQCNERPEYSYLYKSTDMTKVDLLPYDPKSPPSDVATTTTDTGASVPFIVREETGYEDRDRYRIETLMRPGEKWSRWVPPKPFAHKLLLVHGGSCHTSFGPTNPPWGNGALTGTPGQVDITTTALGRGFVVASTALDNSGQDCDPVLQAESILMVKQRIANNYGDLRYTIGEGCSGGSLAEQWMQNAYPGLYQGLITTCTFPDALSTAQQIFDYALLAYYFGVPIGPGPDQPGDALAGEQTPSHGWTSPQVAIVAGDGEENLPISGNWAFSAYSYFGLADPTQCSSAVPADQRYDAAKNPGGVRCGILDWEINRLGARPQSVWDAQEQKVGHGFAGIPVDNVGIQYGLSAVESGVISPQQFVDLNSAIGGADPDLRPVPQRLVADEPALANAYRTGLIDEGDNLDKVAILNLAGPNDPGLAHDSYRAFAIRARLDKVHGTHANQVMWQGPAPIIGDPVELNSGALDAVDRWLTAVEKDRAKRSLAAKVIADKPADLADACFDGNGNKVHDGICGNSVVPVYGTPRTVAGEAITTDQNKCQLKPLVRTDYKVTFTDAQWATLQKTFPAGVCDWSKPGIDQQTVVPWMTYSGAGGRVIVGGRPLPKAPVSRAITRAAR
jgi:hypothetical protein